MLWIDYAREGAGEFMPTPDVALTVGKITRGASERIARVAFTLARQRRRRVAVVHKANVLRLSTGLFLETARAVALDFPDVAVEDYHVDAMAAHLVRRGADFDVILATNMFGDILSDLAAELAGSLGSPRRSTPARGTRWRRPRTARRPTSRGGGSPTRSA